MAGLAETEEFPAEIYQIETTDPVVGGAPNEGTGAGMSNIPHLQLAKRTRWLKAQVDALVAAVVQATTGVAGIVQLSTSTNSTSTTTAATPSAVKAANDNANTRALKTTTIATAGLATGGGDLSANRTITVPKASQAEAEAGTDDTKAMTPLATAQAVAVLAAAIASGKYESPETDVALSTTTTFAHGLGVMPSEYSLRLKCLIAEHGYSVGDETELSQNQSTSGDFAEAAVWANGTEVGVRTYTAVYVFSRSTEARSVITTANWKFIARARK
jgi:hypothetical protein